MEEKKPTLFEWLLYGWLCLNVADVIWVIVGAADTPLSVYGSGGVWAWIGTALVILLGVVATCWLLWRLLTPTWIVLVLATVFYLFQIVELRAPGWAIAFRLGFCVEIRLTDDPDFLVSINLVAIVSAFLYGVAAHHRFEEEGP
jgi:hypothetical protein